MQYAILQEWERRKKTTKRSEELVGQAANEKDPKKLIELIKQIEAILEGQKTAAERQSPQHSAYGRTYRLMGDARFELASLRKNG